MNTLIETLQDRERERKKPRSYVQIQNLIRDGNELMERLRKTT